ncbi:hypothetical protein ALC56_07536 [Trachymyrmex septentrionalis]|uniref:Helix-turn-helix domain-containing protein n=1 Tax=Trachymyrmex septentrionalis TaxID=34720 RepID=A0A151JVT8_9HYME|nr:hypothetical protein ALC56_07536 [Trachymyrmex septentrionalis]
MPTSSAILNVQLIFDSCFACTCFGSSSTHPIAQKKDIIFSLVDRDFLLSDFMFHTKNLSFIINILLDNDYLSSFIFDTVNQRIKNLIKNRYIAHNDLTDNVCVNKTSS